VNNKVLILGNSQHIDAINFGKIADDVTVIGVNRIWYKYIPEYLFFSDIIIYNDMISKGVNFDEKFKNTTIFTSEWIYKHSRKNKPHIDALLQKPNVKCYDVLKHIAFPDAVSSVVSILSRYYKDTRTTYYIAGTELRFNQNKNHFWETPVMKGPGSDWYVPRFNKMFLNWVSFKKTGINIVSVTPKSRLNKLFSYQDISTLYDIQKKK